MSPRTLLPLLGLPLLASACSEYDLADEGAWYGDTGDYGGAAGGDWEADADTDADADADYDDGYGSEDEDSYLALAPATTDVFVFVANPARNTVTRINVPTLEVITTEVGVDPAVVITTEDYGTAVTFNAGSDDVSIIDAQSLEVQTVPVRENFNQMKMSPDGRWVAVFHDPRVDDVDSSGGGAQSFNEVSFVEVATGEHHPRVVGFNPRDIQFTEDGSLAVVVSDAYLAAVDLLTDEPVVERIPITDDLIDPPEAEEVLLVPDGSFAFIRQYGVTDLTVVDLAARLVDQVAVGDNPTDLDVTPDGTQAVAVARGSSELWVYDLADPYAQPLVIPTPEDYVFGSVIMSPDNSKGLLYSTASGEAVYAAWDRETDVIDVYGLVKPVDTVGVSPDGRVALVFHDKSNAEGADPEDDFYNRYALTLVELDDFFPNPLLLAGEPTAYANTDDGEWGFFIMDGEPYVVALDYDQLIDHEITLKSDPVYLGVLPEGHTAYASQEHDLGRISFFDPDTGVVQTITGFELNSGIEY